MLRRWLLLFAAVLVLGFPVLGFAQGSEEDKDQDTATEGKTPSGDEAGDEKGEEGDKGEGAESADEGKTGDAAEEGEEGGTGDEAGEGEEGGTGDEGEGVEGGGTTESEEAAEDAGMNEAMKTGPGPVVVLATSAGVTAGGLALGALLHGTNKTAGGAIMLASLALAPSIGNILLGRYVPAAAWAGIRVVAIGVAYFGFTALEAGANNANDSIGTLGMFALFLGAVAAGTGTAGDIATGYNESISRTQTASRTHGFAVMPMKMPNGSTGMGAGFYATF